MVIPSSLYFLIFDDGTFYGNGISEFSEFILENPTDVYSCLGIEHTFETNPSHLLVHVLVSL